MNEKPSLSFLRFTLLLSGLLVFAACIPSLQPFYSEKDVTSDAALPGSFREKDDSPVWTFAKGEGNQYRLTIRENEKKSAFVVHLFRLADDRFLDLFPADDGLDDCPREDFFKASLVPGHLLLKVPKLGPNLSLQILDEEGLKNLLNEGKVSVPHSFVQNNRLVLTGTTEQLQSFLRKVNSEPKAWGEPAEFRRQK